ncbi:MAG: transglutaminase domain-containing protein [Candidatus Thorarchaeota archaeon]
MTDLREELLATAINKKRVIGVILLALLLISIFAFSTVLISLVFQTHRLDPNKRKSDTEYEYAEPVAYPAPFEDLLDFLEEMLDGDIDDLNLSDFSDGLLDYLFSELGERERFRVFNYLSFADMSDVLWKIECFDEYTGDGWESTAGNNIFDFFTYGEYYSKYFPDPELLLIKMPISPSNGLNSMALPTLFPNPYLMEDSITAPNLNPSSTQLYKTDYNSTTVDLFFTANDDANMTFEIFGLHQPSDFKINRTALNANYTPSSIKNKFLQLPPTINVYRTNNPHFENHYNILNRIIKNDDNAFEVANKIRMYLQANFSFPMTPADYNPAPDGRDIVDWFCETQQGVWSDFASAFCAFTRAFGVSSRFVDGFNSFMIKEVYDNDIGQFCIPIKNKNLYSWAEIYVPTDPVTGNGNWTQMDVFDSFGGGGNPVLGGDYNITVIADEYFPVRPYNVTITAIMTSNTGDPVDNNLITFTDLTSGQILGQNYTDFSGTTSVSFEIDNSTVVGPHIIEARYDLFTAGATTVTLMDDIALNLTFVTPIVNRSDALPDTVSVQGLLYDPLNGKRVSNADINILLFHAGTNIEEFNAFNPLPISTASDGKFNSDLNLNPSVSAGQYEVRADFDGSWYGGYLIVPSINDSSNRRELNITTALTSWFYIDNIEASNADLPSVNRFQTLNLTAKVMQESFGPVPNKMVYFHDFTRGGTLIGSAVSNLKGLASISYLVGDYSITGPNLLFTRIGSQLNFSYYVVNEEPIIHTISGPTPRTINRTGPRVTQFNIMGNITDGFNSSRPLSYSQITLKLLKDGTDYSIPFLNPVESYPYQTGPTGTFDLTFGVAPNTPPGNYTLRIDFNGTIYRGSPYPHVFNLTYISSSAFYSFELEVEADSSLLFSINGIPSDDPINPIINRDDTLNLVAYIHQGGIPITDGEWVYFYDVTQDNLFIGAAQTSGGTGIAQVFYSTNWNTTAGPHLIFAMWNNKFNFSYYILDAPISVNLDTCPAPREIFRSGLVGRDFVIHGYLNDSSNGNHIRNGQIEVRLYDGMVDVSFYLNEPRFTELGQSGEISLLYSVSASTPAKNYTIEVLFNGIFTYTNPYFPQFFNLNWLSNMTDTVNGLYELKVRDPDDIDIFFFIDGNPTQSFYSDLNPPERYNRGDIINFSVYVTQSGSPVNFGTVSFTDVFIGDSLGTQSISNGYASILVDTTSWHAGLHRIRTQWSGSVAFNTTYVIINETVNILRSIDLTSIIRAVDSFTVSGTVQEGGELLRGLRVNLILLDSAFIDVSGYLVGPQTITIDNAGYYQFGNSINISCPQGQYYIYISFTGGIDAPGIWMTDYMIHNSSSLIPIDIMAGVSISGGNYETKYVPDDWYYGDVCNVYGSLYWDNGTAIVGMEINITIRDGNGDILATQVGFTDAFGFFNMTFSVGNWPDNTEVLIYFFPEDIDNFGIPDGLYITPLQQEVFRLI